MKKLLSLMAALGLTATGSAAVVACGSSEDLNDTTPDDNGNVTTDGITLGENDPQVKVSDLTTKNNTTNIKIDNYEDAGNIDASSDDPTIATAVYKDGVITITAIKVGEAVITVTSDVEGFVPATITVTISPITSDVVLTTDAVDNKVNVTPPTQVAGSDGVSATITVTNLNEIDESTIEITSSGTDIKNADNPNGTITVSYGSPLDTGVINIAASDPAANGTDNKVTISAKDKLGNDITPLTIDVVIIPTTTA